MNTIRQEIAEQEHACDKAAMLREQTAAHNRRDA